MFTTETSQMDTGTLNHSSVHPLIEYFGFGHSIRQALGSGEGSPIPSLPELELIYPQTGFVITLAACDYFSLYFSSTPPDRWVSDFLSRSLNHSPTGLFIKLDPIVSLLNPFELFTLVLQTTPPGQMFAKPCHTTEM